MSARSNSSPAASPHAPDRNHFETCARGPPVSKAPRRPTAAELDRPVCEPYGPGGRFSAQLFGDRDGWATEPDMSFQTRQDAEKLLRGLEVEHFDEVEEDGQTAVGDPMHWHLFQVVARKRTR